ncbi:MAG: GNAT family N-acetyltransferase [Thermoanaerobaculaceae bacterium]
MKKPLLAVQENLEALWAYLANWPGWSVHLEADCAWCESPVPHEMLNKVVRFDFSAPKAEEKLMTICRHTTARGIPLGFWLHTPQAEDPHREQLRVLGFQLAAQGWGMVKDLDTPLPVRTEKSVTVMRVKDRETWNRCVGVFGEAFALPYEVVHAYGEQMSAGLAPESPLFHFAVTEKGEVLGMGSLFIDAHGVAGFYNLAVSPAARGRGLGKAILAHAINQAVALGCHTMVLRSTVAAFHLFSTTGFLPVGRFEFFVSRPTHGGF